MRGNDKEKNERERKKEREKEGKRGINKRIIIKMQKR